jgi:hypothetical protein
MVSFEAKNGVENLTLGHLLRDLKDQTALTLGSCDISVQRWLLQKMFATSTWSHNRKHSPSLTERNILNSSLTSYIKGRKRFTLVQVDAKRKIVYGYKLLYIHK